MVHIDHFSLDVSASTQRGRMPAYPADLVEQTSKVYIEAFETITGKRFVADVSGATILDRIRENLRPYFS